MEASKEGQFVQQQPYVTVGRNRFSSNIRVLMLQNYILFEGNLDPECPKSIVYYRVLVQNGYSNSHLLSISH